MSIVRHKATVLDHAQIARPIEVTVSDGEFGLEIEVERNGTEKAHIQLDYFAGVLRLRVYDDQGRGLLNQEVELHDSKTYGGGYYR